jgi:hypothetical protein
MVLFTSFPISKIYQINWEARIFFSSALLWFYQWLSTFDQPGWSWKCMQNAFAHPRKSSSSHSRPHTPITDTKHAHTHTHTRSHNNTSEGRQTNKITDNQIESFFFFITKFLSLNTPDSSQAKKKKKWAGVAVKNLNRHHFDTSWLVHGF